MRRRPPIARARDHRPLRSSTVALSSLLGALVLGGACDCGEELAALPGTVSGQLCSVETGQPLANYPLTLETVDEVIEAKTDLFGQYEVQRVAAGPVTVSAEVDGETRTWEVSVMSGETATVEDDQCRAPPPPPPPPTGTVSGCVCDDARGEWVSGADVFIVTDDGQPVVTGTDDVGCFVLEGVPVGEHRLKVQKGTFLAEHNVTVTEGADFAIETPETCEAPVDPPPGPTGSVSGRVCAPDGTTWLAGATVTVETADGPVQTTTDQDGYYTLAGVPAGEDVVVTIAKGSFETTLVVDVPEGGVVSIPEEECAIDQDVMIAVVDGQWDDVKAVLLNVGIEESTITEYTSGWAGELLTSYETLAQYDIVFFNCGINETAFLDDAASGAIMRDNLRQFVENGGSIYASDQAYDMVEVTFPEFVEFYGPDTTAQAAQLGKTMDSVQGSVVDLALASALGSNQIELHYPLTAWAVMESVSAQVRVYIRADADVGLFTTTTLSNVPHTVSFSAGQGKVVYTSFHQEPGINQQMERVLQLLVFEL